MPPGQRLLYVFAIVAFVLIGIFVGIYALAALVAAVDESAFLILAFILGFITYGAFLGASLLSKILRHASHQ